MPHYFFDLTDNKTVHDFKAAISAAGPAQSAKSSSRSTPSNAATRTAISSGPKDVF